MENTEKLWCPNIRFGTFDLDIIGINYELNDFTVIVVSTENVSEKVISQYAREMITKGCRSFAFCGYSSDHWHRIFDEVDIEINNESDEVSLTWEIDSINVLPDELGICKENALILCTNYETVRIVHSAIVEQGYGFKVRYIGKDSVTINRNMEYYVLSIEKGWFRVLTELDEDYLFPPQLFEIVDY